MAAKLPNGLTVKQDKFARGIIKGVGHEAAAIAAGYSPASARTTAGRLLRNAAVQEVIAKGANRAAEATDITAAKVLGMLVDNAEKGAEEMPIVAHGVVVGSRPVDLGASNSALGLLGKYLRLFVDRSEVTLDSDTRERLDLLLDIIDEEVQDPKVRVRIVTRFAAATGNKVPT